MAVMAARDTIITRMNGRLSRVTAPIEPSESFATIKSNKPYGGVASQIMILTMT
jgi:hypothetical protein